MADASSPDRPRLSCFAWMAILGTLGLFFAIYFLPPTSYFLLVLLLLILGTLGLFFAIYFLPSTSYILPPTTHRLSPTTNQPV